MNYGLNVYIFCITPLISFNLNLGKESCPLIAALHFVISGLLKKHVQAASSSFAQTKSLCNVNIFSKVFFSDLQYNLWWTVNGHKNVHVWKHFWLRQELKEWQSLSVRHVPKLSRAPNLHLSGLNIQIFSNSLVISLSALSLNLILDWIDRA